MFTKQSTLQKVLKASFKDTGISVAISEKGWLFIKTNYIRLQIDYEMAPKEFKGFLVSLIGDLPKPGEAWKYTKKEAQQMEMFDTVYEDLMQQAVNAEDHRRLIKKTHVTLETTDGDIAVWQNEKNEKFMTFASHAAVIDEDAIDEDKGEEPMNGPYLIGPFAIAYNNVMALEILLRDTRWDGEDALIAALNTVDAAYPFLNKQD